MAGGNARRLTIERGEPLSNINKAIEHTRTTPSRSFRPRRVITSVEVPSYLERTLMRAQMVRTQGLTVLKPSITEKYKNVGRDSNREYAKSSINMERRTARSCVIEPVGKIFTKRDIRLKDPVPHVFHAS
jgi:hypothetical protein